MLGEGLEELDVGVRADNLVVVERLAKDAKSLCSVGSVHDELRDERVVVHLGERLKSDLLAFEVRKSEN